MSYKIYLRPSSYLFIFIAKHFISFYILFPLFHSLFFHISLSSFLILTPPPSLHFQTVLFQNEICSSKNPTIFIHPGHQTSFYRHLSIYISRHTSSHSWHFHQGTIRTRNSNYNPRSLSSPVFRQDVRLCLGDKIPTRNTIHDSYPRPHQRKYVLAKKKERWKRKLTLPCCISKFLIQNMHALFMRSDSGFGYLVLGVFVWSCNPLRCE